jgi:hypothetical protein
MEGRAAGERADRVVPRGNPEPFNGASGEIHELFYFLLLLIDCHSAGCLERNQHEDKQQQPADDRNENRQQLDFRRQLHQLLYGSDTLSHCRRQTERR